jgi:hypothetical protein
MREEREINIFNSMWPGLTGKGDHKLLQLKGDAHNV